MDFEDLIGEFERVEGDAYDELGIESLPKTVRGMDGLYRLIADMLREREAGGTPLCDLFDEEVEERLADENFHAIARAMELLRGDPAYDEYLDDMAEYYPEG